MNLPAKDEPKLPSLPLRKLILLIFFFMLTTDILENFKSCLKLFVAGAMMKGAARLVTHYGTSVDTEQLCYS